MADKVLFPISIDSKRFNTEEVIQALNALPKNCQEIVFLIADGLQIYNKISKVHDESSLQDTLRSFKTKEVEYFVERSKWITGLKTKVSADISAIKWTIINVHSVVNSEFYEIYRNVHLAYLTIDNFRKDVHEIIQEYRATDGFSDLDFKLSAGYILEEIAISLKLHVIEKINKEYYLGSAFKLFAKLYNHSYGIDAFDLCNQPKDELVHEFFHSPVIGQSPVWSLLK